MSQSKNGLELLESAFESLEDPRSPHGKIYSLKTILMVAIISIICGADDWVEVEQFGKAKASFFKKYFNVGHRGIPSHDTFGRVFCAIETEVFEKCFAKWVGRLCELRDEVINIDGKTIRRSKDVDKAATHIVSAWANKNRLVLAQVRTAEKSNEITAIPELLKLLSIEGQVITIDAMGTQTEIATQIVDNQADYVLSVKENQKNLYEQISESFYKVGAKAKADYSQELDIGHGRIETRKCFVISVNDYLTKDLIEKWTGLKSMILIQSHIEYKNGKKEGQIMEEDRLYITSLETDAKRINKIVRSHWGIETSLHWVLDVAFREDDNRTRIGNGAANLAVVRHLALNKLRSEKTIKIGVKAKRKKAGWDDEYLLKIIRA